MISIEPFENPDFIVWTIFIIFALMSAFGFALVHKNKIHIEAVGLLRYIIPGTLAIFALITLDSLIKFTEFIK
jgi:hypothetical protein